MNLPDIAKSAAYGALALMALTLAWTALMLGHHIVFSLAKLDAVLDHIDYPCGPALISGGAPTDSSTSVGSSPCGTLADVAKTLNTIRGTAGQVEIAAAHENRQLATLDAQEAQLYTDLHASLLNAQELTASLTSTSEQAGATLHGAQVDLDRDLATLNTAIAGLEPLETQSSLMLGDADALVSDPDLARLLRSSAVTVDNVAGIAKDGKTVADDMTKRYLAPEPWWKKAMGWADLGQKAARTVLPW